MENKEKTRWIVRIVLLVVIIVCLVQICQTYYLSFKHKKQQNEINHVLQAEEHDTGPKQAEEQHTEGSKAQKPLPEDSERIQEHRIMEKYKEIYAVNNDLIGWLTIEDTAIDYPVVRCEDDEYYLHHNLYKEEDQYGCLFVKGIADVDTPCTNFIIYGHNMKDGSMFGTLDEYQKQSFYEEHPVIIFDTLYEERTYEIMAVFLSQVYGKDEQVFKYYQFYQADTEEEFDTFYENVMDMALYETGVAAAFGDTFLMLSTCAYHVEDGRFVVLAKRCE